MAHPLEWRKGLLQKYRSIQALRALAACSVLVSHTYEPVRGAAYGAAGVDLFFVISGFIMASVAAAFNPHVRYKPALGPAQSDALFDICRKSDKRA